MAYYPFPFPTLCSSLLLEAYAFFFAVGASSALELRNSSLGLRKKTYTLSNFVVLLYALIFALYDLVLTISRKYPFFMQ